MVTSELKIKTLLETFLLSFLCMFSYFPYIIFLGTTILYNYINFLVVGLIIMFIILWYHLYDYNRTKN
jgi:hypothetical protein